MGVCVYIMNKAMTLNESLGIAQMEALLCVHPSLKTFQLCSQKDQLIELHSTIKKVGTGFSITCTDTGTAQHGTDGECNCPEMPLSILLLPIMLATAQRAG